MAASLPGCPPLQPASQPLGHTTTLCSASQGIAVTLDTTLPAGPGQLTCQCAVRLLLLCNGLQVAPHCAQHVVQAPHTPVPREGTVDQAGALHAGASCIELTQAAPQRPVFAWGQVLGSHLQQRRNCTSGGRMSDFALSWLRRGLSLPGVGGRAA